MKCRIILFLIGFVVVLAAVVVGGSLYLIDYALVNHDERSDVNRRMERMLKEYPAVKPWIDSLQASHALRDTFIVMANGERQHAVYVADPRACGRTAVLVHGYHDSSVRMLPIASIYSRMGYNILLPDLHAHGLSEGTDIQMGWKDRLDVLRWMSVAEARFRTAAGPSRMVVHGVSMGAATTMCVSGERQPAYVRCYVEDCGYTSVWDEFRHELREQFSLPPFPLLYTASGLCQLMYGWNFREASPLRQVAKSTKSMLFIHGDKDDFVPFNMLQPLYQAKTRPVGKQGRAEKEVWITPGVGHARSFMRFPEEYARKVRTFVGRYM